MDFESGRRSAHRHVRLRGATAPLVSLCTGVRWCPRPHRRCGRAPSTTQRPPTAALRRQARLLQPPQQLQPRQPSSRWLNLLLMLWRFFVTFVSKARRVKDFDARSQNAENFFEMIVFFTSTSSITIRNFLTKLSSHFQRRQRHPRLRWLTTFRLVFLIRHLSTCQFQTL